MQVGNHHQLLNPLPKTHQLNFSAAMRGRCKASDQLSQAGAIDIAYIGEIQQNFAVSAVERLANFVTQQARRLAYRDPPAEVENRDRAGFTDFDSKVIHCARSAILQYDHLNLWKKGLGRVPERVWDQTEIEFLVLADNGLCEISEQVGRLTRLRMLDLGHNRLTSIPDAVGDLAGLTDFLYLH